jgi:hypothetical protein
VRNNDKTTGTKSKGALDGDGWSTPPSRQKVCDIIRSMTVQLTVHKIKEHESEQTEIVIDYKESTKITKTYVGRSGLQQLQN